MILDTYTTMAGASALNAWDSSISLEESPANAA